jgi:hypothetical protein
MTVKILHKDCDPELANDRTLPYTTYLVKYKLDGLVHHDIVMTDKRVDIFDYYWDRYRGDLISFTQSEGRTNPKLWSSPKQEKKKK